MKKTKWTKEEETFLKQNYKDMFYSDIAIVLYKTKRSIQNKATRMKLFPGCRSKGRIMSGVNNPNWKGGISKEHYRYNREARLKYPEKNRAGDMFRYAVRTGKLIRPTICSSCKKHFNMIEGHHEDYNKPLEVKWLCRKCHAREGKEQRLKNK